MLHGLCVGFLLLHYCPLTHPPTHILTAGICGIGLAAVPGTSNHEGGRAVDTSYYSYWLNTLASYGWVRVTLVCIHCLPH